MVSLGVLDAVFMQEFKVQVDWQLDDNNVMVTLLGPSWLLNINATPAEWSERLPQITSPAPSERSEVELGRSAGRPVWWKAKDQSTVCVGQDVESFGFVTVLPSALLDHIADGLRNRDDDWS